MNDATVRPAPLGTLVRLLATVLLGASSALVAGEPVSGWLAWRGNHQTGVSDEKNLPEKIDPAAPHWVQELAGQSTPVIANGKLYVMGYRGEGPDLQEGLFCFDAETGKPLWNAAFNDYLSDIIYLRYASSSPAIDPETGNVFMMGTQGLLASFSADGKLLWKVDMMENFGRLTFPNGRTQSPVVDGPLVIVGAMTANWGAHGPGGHRFYAFDKLTGQLVYASWPGERPKDSSFSTPFVGNYNGQRVFWSGGGDGAVYCVNARTGDPIWRMPVSGMGVNASVLSYKDMVIASHGGTNLESSIVGGVVAIKPGEAKAGPDGKPAVLGKEARAWMEPGVAVESTSPMLAGNRVYQVTSLPAKLFCIDADSGKVLWEKKLGNEIRQSSPTFGDGKMYVGLQEGDFFILKPSDAGAEELCKVKLAGWIQGCASIYRGRIYVQTTEKLYCFGPKEPGPLPPPVTVEPEPAAGALAKFLVVPADMLLTPGEKRPLRLIGVDAKGHWLKETFEAKAAAWAGYIPATARVKSNINGAVADGVFAAGPEPKPSAGAIKGELNGVAGVTRGRVLNALPIKEDFEGFTLAPRETEPKDLFAYPPLPWIGARLKWEVKDLNGNKVLAKTIDDKFFQRALTWIGTPEMTNYTMQADVMSNGQTRKVGGKTKIVKMSEVGLIHNRYIIVLKGNFQEIEINSNLERLQVRQPFAWEPDTWYTLKTRVDIDPATGEGLIRGKAWKKGTPEPEAWSIECRHKTAHKSGSPGVFGLSPQDMPVYIDNLVVTPNN